MDSRDSSVYWTTSPAVSKLTSEKDITPKKDLSEFLDLMYNPEFNSCIQGYTQECPETPKIEKVAEYVPTPSPLANKRVAVMDSNRNHSMIRLLLDDIKMEEGLNESKNDTIHGIVLEVAENDFLVKELRVLTSPGEDDILVFLEDDWKDTMVSVGDYVNIIYEDSQHASITVNNKTNFIVVHPSHLISTTTIADSFQCLRKTILSDRLKPNMKTNEIMILGQISHQLFQTAISSNDFSDKFLHAIIDKAFEDLMCSIYIGGLDEQSLRRQILLSLPTIKSWKDKVLSQTFKFKDDECLSIDCIQDIEESIWSPKFGFRGNIDLTLGITTNSSKVKRTRHIPSKLRAPLEIKSGKDSQSVSHKAQTILYTLLISDRYGFSLGSFPAILCYLKSGSVNIVNPLRDEVRSLIIRRNTIVHHVRVEDGLPSTINQKFFCSKCSLLPSCSVMHQIEGGRESIYLEGAPLMSNKDKDFLFHWDSFISSESTKENYHRMEMFGLSSKEREQLGRCLASLVITNTEQGGNIFVHSFQKSSQMLNPFSFLSTEFNVGDPIILSENNGSYGLGTGFIVDLKAHTITIRFNSHFQSRSRKLYRIDKDELSSATSLSRNNIMQLFTSKDTRNFKELIVDLKPPRFVKNELVIANSNLNSSQQKAINHCFSAMDYSLILGMPGTGKTTTIAYMIQSFVEKGMKILVTSYTHSALDHIMLKLISLKVSILRLGNVQKIHKDVSPFAYSNLRFENVVDMGRQISRIQVVGTTCLGMKHALFLKERFDLCIVDEASQVTLPVCVGPILSASRFILVGDPYQLPPLTKSKKDVDVSLFKRLADAHPNAVTMLEYQYRMNKEIMYLANELVYGGKLRVGSIDVASAELSWRLPNSTRDVKPWILQALDPKKPVAFVDTDRNQRDVKNKVLQNEGEVKLISEVINALHSGGIESHDIGIITPFRAQIKLLKESLGDIIEIDTVDKYQGRDKECIIMSMVKENDQEMVGDLLRDWHRLNVAITRAKKKLIFFGNIQTLVGGQMLSSLVNVCRKKGFVIEM